MQACGRSTRITSLPKFSLLDQKGRQALVFLITALLVFVAAVVAFADWRRGLFAAVPVALLQDPLRKLAPGEPVFYVVLVGLVIAAAALAATMSNVSLMPTRIRGWHRYLGVPFVLFIAVIVLQALNSIANFGNFMIVAIGCLAYLTPFVALCLVYQTVVRSPTDYIVRYLKFYILCTLPVLATIYFDFAQFDWPALGEVGIGIIIFDMNAAMIAYSGLFRSSEIAAWHAATVVIFVTILIVSTPAKLNRILLAALIVTAVIALGMLTGRRKFLIVIVVFASAYASFLLYFGRGSVRLALLSCLAGLIGSLSLFFLLPDEPQTVGELDSGVAYESYLLRGHTVFGDVPDRFTGLGLAPVIWAYNRYGLIGAGLGAGSQGTQYFGAEAQGAAEGGLGKIWVELGAPGVLIAFLLAVAFMRHLWHALHFINRRSIVLTRLACGLLSFVVANVAMFAVATQAFGDIFILLLIGMAVGSVMAMPMLAERLIQRPMPSLSSNQPVKTLAPRPRVGGA